VTAQRESLLDSYDDARVVSWIESLLDRAFVGFPRQPRWWPMWFVNVDRGGDIERVVICGTRADTPFTFSLAHELSFPRLLDEPGISLPHVQAGSGEPRARLSRPLESPLGFAGPRP
jgi:hypothetical protein